MINGFLKRKENFFFSLFFRGILIGILVIVLSHCLSLQKTSEDKIDGNKDRDIGRASVKVKGYKSLESFPYDNSGYVINNDGDPIELTLPENGQRKGSFQFIQNKFSIMTTQGQTSTSENSHLILLSGSLNEKITGKKSSKEISLSFNNRATLAGAMSLTLSQNADYTVKKDNETFSFEKKKYSARIPFNGSIIKSNHDSLFIKDWFDGKGTGIRNYSLPFLPSQKVALGHQWEKQVIIENEQLGELSLLTRLYTFSLAGYTTIKGKKAAYIEFVYQDYKIAALDLNKEEVDSKLNSMDLKSLAKTFTKINSKDIFLHLKESQLKDLFSTDAMSQASGKGAGFVIYDFTKHTVLDWREGGIRLDAFAMTSGNSNSINLSIEKTQTIYKDSSIGTLDNTDFNECEKSLTDCKYVD
jgi:hypothetical protein